MPGSDRRTDSEWPIRPAPKADVVEPTAPRPRSERETSVVKPRRTGISPAFIALGALVLLLLVVWLLTSRNPNQDKLTGTETAAKTAADPETLCASPATYDLIKRDLFRQAAQLRGSDQPAFDKLSSYAALRVENPVMESQDKGTGAINCSASLSIDLPPGVAAVGGRRTLTSEADYTIQPAADGSGNVLLLHNVDAIVSPLATLARADNPEQAQAPPVLTPGPAAPPVVAPQAIGPNPQPAPPPPIAAPPQPRAVTPRPPQPAPASAAQPSFNCAKAHTAGEIAVCQSSSLASLDRQMAGEYGHAFAVANPAQRALLRSTAHRFYAYRDHCPDRQCIAGAYSDRVREIRDIVSGRWAPPG